MFPIKPLSAYSKLNLVSTPYSSLRLCLSSYHFFHWNVPFPLQSYLSLKISLNCHFLCGAPITAPAGCNIFLLLNLDELCFYYLYSTYCQDGYAECLPTSMAKYWSVRRGASWIISPGIDLSHAAKLVPQDLSSSSGLYAPSGQPPHIFL